LDLSKIPFAAEECVKTDPKNQFMYERVAARAENIIVMRTGQFLVHTRQDGAYVEWEQSHLQQPKDAGEDLQARFIPVGWTTK
jgi:c-di-GMP-binding flagellar brake protein YcgR